MQTVADLKLSRPAQRALAGAGIKSLKQFENYTEKEIAGLHGIGPNAIKTIKEAMKNTGIEFLEVK